MAPTLNEIFELKCLSELEDVGSVALYIGLLAIPLCLLMPLPQYYKLYKRGSAAGFSSLMLYFGNIGRALNVINLIILHYDQASLLVLYSGITGFASLFPLYFVVMIMNSRTTVSVSGVTGSPQVRRLWIGLISQMLIIVAVGSPIVLLMQIGKCAPFQAYANVVGFFNAFFLCTQFVPQIVLTWMRKEGGAVSYMMYFPDVIGGYIMTVEKAFGTHERISTWMPYALMHTLELIMLILNAAYDDAFREWLSNSIRFHRSRQPGSPFTDSEEELEDAAIMKRESVVDTCKLTVLTFSDD